MPSSPWYTIVPVIALVAPTQAGATTYLTVAAAQRVMFPGALMVDRSIALGKAQRKAIAKAARAPAPGDALRVWEAREGSRRTGWFLLDRVIGKHEYITYAVALSPDGTVRGIEILDYRETYGDEVRNAAWRKQFVGKKPGQRLELGKNIRNISGATLSSRHITDGVRRLLVAYDLFLKGR